MRITETEKEAIVEAALDVDPGARIWLFGSRTDDRKKGGDIDIGILSSKIDFMEEMRIRRRICDRIGEQKIDIVVSKDAHEAFFRYAVQKGILLNGQRFGTDTERKP